MTKRMRQSNLPHPKLSKSHFIIVKTKAKRHKVSLGFFIAIRKTRFKKPISQHDKDNNRAIFTFNRHPTGNVTAITFPTRLILRQYNEQGKIVIENYWDNQG